MPAPSTQDFTKGADFTGINPVASTDLNALVDQASTFNNGNVIEGTGIILITKDSALNTPVVPDAVTTTKWKRNIWMRIPFTAAGPFTIYNWNDANPSDAVYLKWSQIIPDLTAINADIAALQIAVNTAQLSATNAYNLAASVSGQATTALSTANQALTTANNASTAAASATATADATAGQLTALQTSVTNATNTANAASTSATAAQTAVNNLLATYNFAILVEQTNAGVDLGNIVAGVNLRSLNVKLSDINNIVTLAGGKITIVKAGTYLFDVVIPYVPDITGPNSQRVLGMVVRDSDSVALLIGQPSVFTFTGIGGVQCAPTLYTHIKGILVATAGLVVRIDLKAASSNGELGTAANLGHPENYTLVRIDQIA